MGRNTNSLSVVVNAPRKQNFKATNEFIQDKVCIIPATNPMKKLDPYQSMVPPPKTVLNYDICQTDTKLKKAVKTGVAQVHVTQTDALYKYPPADYVFPEDVKKDDNQIEYGTGGPPVWKFEEEKLWERVQRQQHLSKHKFQALQVENKKYDKMILAAGHQKLLSMVGPDWFQELSTEQLIIVEQLKSCIFQDQKHNTLYRTQENISSLGLMTRPRVRHIKTALDNCCKCPVEFLLILYQLMNEKRTEYSINDRLLLSGVVHLTIRDTLKELHIRIPSPPPHLKPKKAQKPFPKKSPCKSPYLQQFDFKPCPRKHTGIYKNNHIQYPESLYFSYIANMKKEMKFTSNHDREIYIQKKQFGITLEQHNEIVNELKSAQKQYKNLTDLDTVPYLLKPSIHILCDHNLFGKSSTEDIETEHDTSAKGLAISIALKVTNENDYKKLCECNVLVREGQVSCPDTPSVEESEHMNQSLNESLQSDADSRPQTPKRAESPATPQSTQCKCKEEAEKFIEQNLFKEDEKDKNNLNKAKCDCLEKYQSRVKLYEEMKKKFVVQYNLTPLPEQCVTEGATYKDECSCANLYQEQLKEQERLANMPELPQGKQKYVVCGVHPTDKGNVFVLAGAVNTEECSCQKLYKSYEERHTSCLDAYDKYVKKVEADVVKYFVDIENDTRFDPDSTRSLKGSNVSNMPTTASSQKEDDKKLMPITESCEEKSESVDICECGETTTNKPSSGSIDICTCGNPPCTCVEPDVCVCEGLSEFSTFKNEPVCTCNDEESVIEEPESPLRRYTILNKLPSKYTQQMEILKNALAIMAEDGFPLAKLPDSWKLPIFKLWMQERSGKHWSQDDRMTLHSMNLAHWHHTDHCKGKVKQSALLGMPLEKADRYTWAHATIVKKIALEKETSYYREIKQIAINEAREYYPTTFSYELPNSAFRDCYFAYLPPKEDSCSYWRPWYIHEYKKKK